MSKMPENIMSLPSGQLPRTVIHPGIDWVPRMGSDMDSNALLFPRNYEALKWPPGDGPRGSETWATRTVHAGVLLAGISAPPPACCRTLSRTLTSDISFSCRK
jgi:hypothetical protein